MSEPADKAAYAAWLKEVKAMAPRTRLQLPISRFALSSRAHTAFRRGRIKTLDDLCWRTEEGIKRMAMVGDTTQKEILAFLASIGIKLRTDAEVEREWREKKAQV